MKKLRILIATMEIDPFLRVTGAAEFVRLLPQGLQDMGHEIRILMPKFGVINEKKNRLHEVVRLSGINIRVGDEEKPLTIKVATIPQTRLQVYFLDNEDYFLRKSVLHEPDSDKFHDDNDERAIFFCKGVIETVKKLNWTPHIVHCLGWMTSLIPVYLKTHFREDPLFRNCKVVHTFYENETNPYHYPLAKNFAEKARLQGAADPPVAETVNTFLSVTREGMKMADAVTKTAYACHPLLDACIEENNIHCVEFDHTRHAIVENYQKLYQTMLS
ncbi:MAG: glycogen/starch synthase [Bacteroidia bacterium]|nr:glycogen/starch synthase [Bacteroidia bacterium]MDW8333752.1 glycogen/starch synthase [Bacteroidia bacterium]